MCNTKCHIFRIVIMLGWVALAGCDNSSPSGLPTASMKIGSKTYQLEIAANDTSREHGLMERDTLCSDRGMIFLFREAQVQSFWMKHTRFPLDIIFADQNANVVSIHGMIAYSLDGTSSDEPAKYAIELSAGEARSNGVKVGDKLQIPKAVLTSEID